MMKHFSIYILIYGRWQKYRDNTEMSSTMARDHLHTALSELYIYSNHFDHIKDVQISIEEWVKWEDEDWGLPFEVPVVTTYSWWDSDYEEFKDFHQSVLSPSEFIF